jgi:2-dehydropantoate 2-reductase
MRVAVLGAGAVGAYYGSRLAGGGADVTLIARGRHLDALRADGLTVVEPEGTSSHRLPATDDPATLGPVDLVLFCVKSFDTDAAAWQMGPLVGADTAVLSLQNGIDNEDRIAAIVGPDHVIGGAAYILGAIREPGVIDAAGPRRIVIGELRPGPPSARILAIAEVGERGGLRVDAVEDVRVAKWEKYTLLVAFSAMTAAIRLPIGAIRSSPAAAAMMRAIMSEVRSVGRAIGVPLADDLVDRQMRLLLSQADEATTSLYHDLVTGHRMELEALQGAAIRLGREAGVATPSTEAAYAILQPWAMRNEPAAADGRPMSD